MTDLSRALRERLLQCSHLTLPRTALSQLSIDGTRKYLFELNDGEKIESVFIPEEHRDTLCISTQVGCPMDCKFCLTALIGLARNLTAGEIAGPVLSILEDRQDASNEPSLVGCSYAPHRNSQAVHIVLLRKG